MRVAARVVLRQTSLWPFEGAERMSTHHDSNVPTAAKVESRDLFLFWACFIALIATAFAFIIRALIMDEWQRDFALTETEKGEIFGVGLWPFAISIVLFSLIIDRIGYGKAMAFAFVSHLAAAVILFFAKPLEEMLGIRGYWVLYIGSFVMALGNGTVEAVINPVVATLFPNAKTKWLNALHAGWPGGLVLGGILTIAMSGDGVIGQMVGGEIGWKWKVALVFLPIIAYGVLMLPQKFPISERVAAGVSYKGMLQQVGILGALIVSVMIVWEVTRVFMEMGWLFQEMGASSVLTARLVIVAILTGAYGAYVHSLGRPVFIFLLLIMIPLATTELGTDSWITSLMEPEMARRALHPGWVLVYTSLIMLILRFFAGPIVHRISTSGIAGGERRSGGNGPGLPFGSHGIAHPGSGHGLRFRQDVLLADDARRGCGAVPPRGCHDAEHDCRRRYALGRRPGQSVAGEYSGPRGGAGARS